MPHCERFHGGTSGLSSLQIRGLDTCALVGLHGPPADNIREEWAERPKGSGIRPGGVTIG